MARREIGEARPAWVPIAPRLKLWQNGCNPLFQGESLFSRDRMKCKEHRWEKMDVQWLCAACGIEAAAKDPDTLPCPRCGATADPKLVYCHICLDQMFGLELLDA